MGWRPRIAECIFVLLLASSMSPPAWTQSYPVKPVRILIGFSPGGPIDVLGRAMAQNLNEAWGQPVVVENRPGASGNIAMLAVAHAPPDGHTLVIATASSLTVNQYLYSKLGYDPVRDFVPITQLAKVENVLVVNSGVPAKTVQELIEAAKQRPGTLTFGSPGNGSQAHLKGELLKLLTGIDIVHVPYKGDGPAMTDLLGGRITMMFGFTPSVRPHIASGGLRVLGAASAKRLPTLPDLPTLAEQGLPGLDSATWYGLMAPAGTPSEIIEKIYADVRRVLYQPKLKQTLDSLGADPVGNSPPELATMMKNESERWRKVIEQANIRAD